MSENTEQQHYIIVGAGQAGAEVTGELRKRGFEGRITLIGDESLPPYRRPPLSKAYFSGEAEADSLLVLKPPQLEKNEIDFISGVSVEAIDTKAHSVTLSDGRKLEYDKLALTTGGRARPLPCPGNDLDGVFLLRNVADVDAIRARCVEGTRLAIVGGGFIGLEVAASARKAGLEVTVIETLDRVLARVTAPVVSAFFERIHREAGVDVRTGARVEGIEGKDKVEGVRLEGGEVIPADVVVVGIGLIPNVELAKAAGLETDNGIVVDACAQTSDPDIVAAGDCANHPNRFAGGRTRLESVQNAMEQARTAAGTMLGAESPYDAVPWFWSDQYDCKLQMAGLSGGYDDIVLRGDPEAEKRFSAFYLRDGQLIAADSVGRPQDFMFAKKLVTLGIKPEREQLADPELPLKGTLTELISGGGIAVPKLHFVEPDGTERIVDAVAGQSVMEAATGERVPGIIGECGGSCSCATCHVYVDQPWFDQLGPVDEMESLMLEGAVEPGPQSRLCCQIEIAEDLEGMVLRIPAGQL